MKLVKNKAPSKTRELIQGVVLASQTLSLLIIAYSTLIISLELAPQARLLSTLETLAQQYFAAQNK